MADVELKAIPSTSAQAEEIVACRACIENLMKKEDFFIDALRHWCRSIAVGWKHEDGHIDEEDTDTLCDVELGFSFINAAQVQIDLNHDRAWADNPALRQAAREGHERQLTPRLQCLIDNGLLPPRAPFHAKADRTAEDAVNANISSDDELFDALDALEESYPELTRAGVLDAAAERYARVPGAS